MRTYLSLSLFCLGLFPVLGSAQVMTTNAKAAASLQSVAFVPEHGAYTFTNVKTGERLTYVATGNHIYPAHTSGTDITITAHGNANWIRLSFGSKNKCLSSAWGGSYDNAAVAYVCATGTGGVKDSTLEKTKQWWLAVSIDHTSGNPKASNQLLIAAQLDSVATRTRKLKALKNAFGKRSVNILEEDSELSIFEDLPAEEEDVSGGESGLSKRDTGPHELVKRSHRASKKAHSRAKKAHKKVKKSKKSKTTVSSSSKGYIGTFFIIPSDHLIDLTTRALTAQVVVSRGIKTTALMPWNKTNKSQMWMLTKN